MIKKLGKSISETLLHLIRVGNEAYVYAEEQSERGVRNVPGYEYSTTFFIAPTKITGLAYNLTQRIPYDDEVKLGIKLHQLERAGIHIISDKLPPGLKPIETIKEERVRRHIRFPYAVYVSLS